MRPLTLFNVMLFLVLSGVVAQADVSSEAPIENKLEGRVNRSDENRVALKKAFFDALSNCQKRRKLPLSSHLDCSDLFAQFGQNKNVEPYIDLFHTLNVPVIRQWANQRQYVYFEIPNLQLWAMGYLRFFWGDRLVVVFTTASRESTEVTSFKAVVLNSEHL